MPKKKLLLSGLTLLALTTIGLLTYFSFPAEMQTITNVISSQEKLRDFIQSYGAWAPIIFMLIQIAQIIISPIPGNITTLAGGYIFGPLNGFLLSFVSTVIGSLMAFYLARWLGQGFVVALVGEKNFVRYNSLFSSKYTLTLLLMFLVPFFPDDILCFLVGLTALPGRVFLIILLIGRIPGILFSSLIGAGIFTFSIWQWIIIAILSLAAIIYLFLYGNKFEEWLRKQHPTH